MCVYCQLKNKTFFRFFWYFVKNCTIINREIYPYFCLLFSFSFLINMCLMRKMLLPTIYVDRKSSIDKWTSISFLFLLRHKLCIWFLSSSFLFFILQTRIHTDTVTTMDVSFFLFFSSFFFVVVSYLIILNIQDELSEQSKQNWFSYSFFAEDNWLFAYWFHWGTMAVVKLDFGNLKFKTMIFLLLNLMSLNLLVDLFTLRNN